MTHQKNKSIRPTHPIIAKWCIWSIENQSWLAGRLRVYIWGGVASVAFFTFVGLITLETALWSIFFSGLVISTAIYLLIRQRKSWLLSIQSQEQRQQALKAMVDYLHSVDHVVPLNDGNRRNPEKGSRDCSDKVNICHN